MLLITREKGQTIVINPGSKEEITIHVMRGKVSLGIEADRSIPVVRGELLDREPADGDNLQRGE